MHGLSLFLISLKVSTLTLADTSLQIHANLTVTGLVNPQPQDIFDCCFMTLVSKSYRYEEYDPPLIGFHGHHKWLLRGFA